MNITFDHAFWLLNFYRRYATPLTFGGRILGEQAVSVATVMKTDRASRTVTLSLLNDDGLEPNLTVPLTRAEFDLLRAGDPEFHTWYRPSCHSVLRMVFPDGTTLFFAEGAQVD